MVSCTQITVEEQAQDVSELEVTAIDAPNAISGGTIEVTVTVSNTIVEGNGEAIMRDVIVSGAGYEVTSTIEVAPGASEQIIVNFVPSNTGSQEICAELI